MKRGIVTIFILGLSVAACGSDDDDGGGGGSTGAGAAALQSCQAYCDAQATCGDYTSVDECKSSECDGVDRTTGACADAIKAFYDCQKAATDICFPECSAQGDAYLSACAG